MAAKLYKVNTNKKIYEESLLLLINYLQSKLKKHLIISIDQHKGYERAIQDLKNILVYK